MGKPTRSRDKKQKSPANRPVYTLGAIILAAVVIAVLLITLNLTQGATQTADLPNPAGMSLGDPNAPVKVEEFSDFQCPYCAQFALNAQAGFIEKYVKTGKVYFTYIPFSFIGPESVRAAEAAYCAADQNKFWEFHDALFKNQGGENTGVFSDNKLIGFAQKTGLNMAEFRSCFDSGKYKEKVQTDLNDGKARGVTGTPSFIVNGQKPVFANALESAIEQALNGGN
jgi:protein-disulfide isomerase